MTLSATKIQTKEPEQGPLAESGFSHRRLPTPRFTLDGGAELENHLARTCQQVLAGVQSIMPAEKLEAILLGGGYGRGEGGVLKTESDDRPYNDLEFYVCLRGNVWLNEQRYARAMHGLAGELSSEAGVEVELKLFSLAKLHRSPISMFYYDLVMGHRWIWGEEKLLAGCERHRHAERIPLSEATRLLMNRCSGLLFAKERLLRDAFTPDDADFVGRNLAKAQLAFGDAVLTAFGQYHWSCRERHARLERLRVDGDLPWPPRVLENHFAGMNFKLHPRRTTATTTALATEHGAVVALGLRVWLWLESRRLNHPFASARDYALSPINKCPESNRWRNRLVNLKTFGPANLFKATSGTDPRARLLHSLPLLLFEPATPHDSRLLGRVQSELRTTARTWGELVMAYRSLWCRFN